MHLEKKMVVRVVEPGDGRVVTTSVNARSIWPIELPWRDELTGRLCSTSQLGPARRPCRRAEP